MSLEADEDEEAPLASDGFFDWDDMDREADMKDDDFDTTDDDDEEEDQEAAAATEAMLERARKRRKAESEAAMLDDAFEGGEVDEKAANARYDDFFEAKGKVEKKGALQLQVEASLGRRVEGRRAEALGAVVLIVVVIGFPAVVAGLAVAPLPCLRLRLGFRLRLRLRLRLCGG